MSYQIKTNTSFHWTCVKSRTVWRIQTLAIIRLFLLALLLLCNAAYAEQTFGVEEALARQTPIPESVLSDLNGEISLTRNSCAQSSLAEALEATKVEIGSKDPTILVKPKSNAWCLCGAYYCPVWMYQITNVSTKRVWYTPGTSTVTILKAKTRGYRKIQSAGGTAGHGFEELWVWDGKKYQLAREKSWVAGQ